MSAPLSLGLIKMSIAITLRRLTQCFINVALLFCSVNYYSTAGPFENAQVSPPLLPPATSDQLSNFSSNAEQQDVGQSILELGKPVEREISPGVVHIHRVALTAGQYVLVTTEQRGIDVVMTLLGPDGKKIIDIKNTSGSQGTETLSWIAEVAGRYPIIINPVSPKATAGRYVIKVVEQRTASEQDHKRIAQQAFVEAGALAEQKTKESWQQSVVRYEVSLASYRALGDKQRELMVLMRIGYLYFGLENLKPALDYYTQALPVSRTHGTKLTTGQILFSLGLIYSRLRGPDDPDLRYQRAIDHFAQALPMLQQVLERNGEALTLENLGVVYSALRMNGKAVEYFNHAAAAYQTLGNRQKSAELLVAIGEIYEKRFSGKEHQTLEYYQRALDIFKAIGDAKKSVELETKLRNLRVVVNAEDKLEKTQQLYQRGLSVSQADTQEGRRIIEQAVKEMESAYSDLRKLAFVPTRLEVVFNDSIGSAYASLGDESKSMPYFRRALKSAQYDRDALSNQQLNTAYNLARKHKPLVNQTGIQPDQDKPQLVTQDGHADGVIALDFSPGGKILASGGLDGSVKLWDTRSEKLIGTLATHVGKVSSVNFAPDGDTLLVEGRKDGTELWDIQKHGLLLSLNGRLKFSPDGKLIACYQGPQLEYSQTPERFQSSIEIWDSHSGHLLKQLEGHTGDVLSVEFSPDGKTLVSGSVDRTVKLWEVESGKLLFSLEGHSARVNLVAFADDGNRFVSESDDGTHRIWAVGNGSLIKSETGKYSNKNSKATVCPEAADAAFSPDGRIYLLIQREPVAEADLPRYAQGSAYLPKMELRDAKNCSLVSQPDYSWENSGPPDFISNLDSNFAFSPDSKTIASGSGKTINIWDIKSGKLIRNYSGVPTFGAGTLLFDGDGRNLFTSDNDYVRVFDVQSGSITRSTKLKPTKSERLVNPNGEVELVLSEKPPGVELRAVSDGHRFSFLPGDFDFRHHVQFSPDGNLFILGKELRDARTSRLIRRFPQAKLLQFSRDSKTIVGVNSSMEKVSTAAFLFDVQNKTVSEIASFKSSRAEIGISEWARSLTLFSVKISSDKRRLALIEGGVSGSNGSAILFDVVKDSEIGNLSGESGYFPIVFSADDKLVASVNDDTVIELWKSEDGDLVNVFEGHTSDVTSLDFSPDSKTLVSSGQDGTVKFWSVENGELLATLFLLKDGDWLVVTPDGLFDGSPAAWSQIFWRFKDASDRDGFSLVPVEIFFSEFYRPGLLGDAMSGIRPEVPRSISQLDRRQPKVKLSATSLRANEVTASRTVAVKIDVSEPAADQEHQAGSGVKDVRLFRNGSLVKVWRGDALNGRTSATLEASVPIVGGENRLTAYAFNRDNVKSADATLTVKGTLQSRKGTLYVLAIGVNKYANPQFDLKYAEPDARGFGAELQRQQQHLNQYSRVEVIPLLDHEATKANILLAIKRLAGVDATTPSTGAPQTLERIKRAEPEDVVVIYFAGHGLADQPRFYLIPHDIGYDGPRSREAITANLKTVFAHGVSDEELERELEGVDAARIVMVIDACHSGQALEAEEKRRGPMNSKGLAQLAYEKGMYILTAAQSYQAALGSGRLGHGYLTYALIEEGLKGATADLEPKDGQVLLREWLNYATDRVPRMQEERIKQERRLLVQGSATKEEGAQRPRVFYRRELEAQSLIIARTPTVQPRRRRNPAVP